MAIVSATRYSQRMTHGCLAILLAVVILSGCAASARGRQPCEAPVRSGFAAVEGGRLYYEVYGRGQPVVLIHGGNLDRRLWGDQLCSFASRWQVIQYDVRGYGRSPRAAAPYAGEEDLAALLAELGVTRASIVGLSLGGRIAIDFALTHPDHVDRLVLAGPGLTGFTWSHDDDRYFEPIGQAVRAGDSLRAADLWLETPYMRPAMMRPELSGRVRILARANASSWMDTSAFERALEPPAIARLGAIQVPTLLILGEQDVGDIHRIVDTLAKSIRGARVVTVPHAGHLVNMESPREFERLVVDFLTSDKR